MDDLDRIRVQVVELCDGCAGVDVPESDCVRCSRQTVGLGDLAALLRAAELRKVGR